MDDCFSRTLDGLRNRHLFHPEPIVWVEGSQDAVYYGHLARSVGINIMPTDGKELAIALANYIREEDAPYIVVIDGDYDLLDKRRRGHRRVIMLDRYSVENYLFEHSLLEEAVKFLASDFSGREYTTGAVSDIERDITSNLKDLIAIDHAVQSCNSGDPVMPQRIERILQRAGHPAIDPTLAAELTEAAEKSAKRSGANLEASAKALGNFLKERPLGHLLRGHLLFGILRYAISNTLVTNGFYKAPDDRSLRTLFATLLWSGNHHPDHRRLVKKLREGVHEINKRKASFTS